MKGLLIKDLLSISGFRKQYGLVFIFMVFWTFFMKSISFLLMYMILLGGMLALTTMSLDESVHFSRYALTMPISVRTLVKEKYVALFLSLGVSGLVAVIFGGIFYLFLNDASSFKEEVFSLIFIWAFFLIAYSISFPVMFKLGVEKARYVYMFVMIGMAAVVLGVTRITDGSELPAIFDGNSGVILAIVILAAVAAIAVMISYLTSLRMVRDKEW